MSNNFDESTIVRDPLGKFDFSHREQDDDIVLTLPDEPVAARNFGDIKDRESRLEAMHAEIEHGLDTLCDGAEWRAFLDFYSSFHHYSFQNTWLIRFQRPEATNVAGFKKWKELGRTVKRGERGIWILAPMIVKDKDADGNPDPDGAKHIVGYRAVAVFDESQTEKAEGEDGKDLPENPRVHKLVGDEVPSGMVESLTSAIEGAGYSVSHGDTGRNNGYTEPSSKKVVLSTDISPRQAAKTLSHEAAHIALGHVDNTEEYHGGGRPVAEIEAESTSYIVSRSWGLDDAGDYSFGYIDSWAGGDRDQAKAKVKEALTAVVKAAKSILDGNI